MKNYFYTCAILAESQKDTRVKNLKFGEARCMRVALAVPLLSALVADAQIKKMRRRPLSADKKPECSSRAICFSGEVSAGEEVRKVLNDDLDIAKGCALEIPGRRNPEPRRVR